MGALRERLHHDALRGALFDGDRRYVMMRADVLMGIVHEVPPPQRQAVLAAMARSVQQHGGRSAQAYFRAIDGDPLALLRVMAESSADLGWGRWQFNTRHDTAIASPADLADGLRLRVRASPFAAGHGPHSEPVCAPILGMLRAVGELLYDADTDVHETQCAAQGHTDCCFELLPDAKLTHT